MKGALVSYLTLALTIATVGLPTESHAFFKRLFRKSPTEAPQGEERTRMEQEANARLAEAADIAESGNRKAAIKACENVVENYPLATAAADAQFRIGDLLRQEGKLEEAFDALQKLVTNYRRSPRFGAALEAQFEIAEVAKAGQKVSFVGIPMKVTNSRIIEMYETLITNAPFGRNAPQARFSIAEIHQDLGRQPEAIAAYQKVVDDYPRSPQAKDAQFRIGQIRNIIALRSEDVGSIREAQAAMQTFVLENPDATESPDAEAILTTLKERDLEKDMEIARFYERTGRKEAAAIYYQGVMKYPDSEFHAEAGERLANIQGDLPGETAGSGAPARGTETRGPAKSDPRVAAAELLKANPRYVGPRAPDLDRLLEKPEPRLSPPDDIVAQDEPPAPLPEGAGEADNILLPPAPGEAGPAGDPARAPLPPAPGEEETAPQDPAADPEPGTNG